MIPDPVEAAIVRVGQLDGLDADLLRAICLAETNANPLKTRYEPAWHYFFFPRDMAELLGISVETEQVLQAMSWGPMQLMGSVAREEGYRGDLTALVDPSLALDLSGQKLKKLRVKYAEEAEVIAAWNAGSVRKTAGGLFVNQVYVDRVSARLLELRKIKS